jgi:hypothetical protein
MAFDYNKTLKNVGKLHLLVFCVVSENVNRHIDINFQSRLLYFFFALFLQQSYSEQYVISELTTIRKR